MRAIVESLPIARRVRVWLVDHEERVLQLHAGSEASWLRPGSRGADVPPTLELDERLFAALVQEGMQLVPADAVMERAWKDAIAVRDRLLTLIERRL